MDKYYELSERYLRDLVAINTVNKPGNEKAAALYISRELERYNFKTEIQEVAEGRANVVASIGGSSNGNTVIFTGHLDVVPPGENWKSGDPFTLLEKDGKLYGRGSCDMKGGVSAMMAAAVRLVEENEIHGCELRLVFVADEEVDGIGTLHYVASAVPTERTIAVIGEPTMLELDIAHRGVTRFRVVINGKQCHSGTPHLGNNAIYATSRFLLKVEEFDRSRQSMDCGILPPPNITATLMNSGIKENVVPGSAEIVLDCRTVPGETAETLGSSLKAILAELFDGTETTYSIEDFINVYPSKVEADGRVCTILKQAYRNAFDNEPVVTYFKGCCDMSYFCKAGFAQTLLCGPGSMDQAHVVDEFISKDQLHRGVNLYTEVYKCARKG